jgi:hypothetical protein
LLNLERNYPDACIAFMRRSIIRGSKAIMKRSRNTDAAIPDPREGHRLAERFRYSDDGRRGVKPYYHAFRSYVKGRWIGRTLFDVFSGEFASHTPEYFVSGSRVMNCELASTTQSRHLLLS